MNLKEILKTKGIAPVELAKLLNWSKGKVYRAINRPQQLKLYELAQIAEVIDVPLCCLI